MSEVKPNQTGLAKATDVQVPEVINTPSGFAGAVDVWQRSGLKLLTPFTTIGALAHGHAIFPTTIQIDLNPQNKEVYDGLPFLKNGEVALAKNGLRRLAEGLGIRTRLEYITAPGRIANYWNVKAIASYTGIDGRDVSREAGCEWDLRDGSPRLKGWTAAQIQEARKHGQRACETRAINAAIRECGCGVKQAYTREELKAPFLAIRVAMQPDMSDPDIKRLMTEHFIGARAALYAGSPEVAGDPWADDGDGAPAEPRRVGASTLPPSRSAAPTDPPADAGATTAQAAAPAVDPNLPPFEGAVRIVDVKDVTGTTAAKDGKPARPWTRFDITDSNGEVHTTFSKTIADSARKAAAAREWVDMVVEQNGRYKNLLEIQPYSAEADVPLPGMGTL